MNATKLFPSGAWEVSDIIDGYLVRRAYQGYNKRGALAQFRDDTTPKGKCEYTNDGTRITAPGKFEGCPVFAPYFWEIGLDGFSDSDDGENYVFRFKAGDAEFSQWPTLKAWLGRKRTMRLHEDGNGFIHCS